MRSRGWFVAGFLLVSLAMCAASPAYATWSTTGEIAAGADPTDESCGFLFNSVGTNLAAAPDGGVYVAYIFGDSLRINRLSGDNGARLWGTIGVKINQGGNADSPPFVVADGSGGCWVAWVDHRSGNQEIFVQRFDSDGNAQGPAGGFVAAGVVGTGQPFGPAITASGSKLLLAYWRTGVAGGLHVQRIQMAGGGAPPVLDFPSEPAMTTDEGSPSDTPIHVLADGAGGGGYVVWASNRGSLPGGANTVKIVANHFNTSGAAQWGAEGIVVQAATGNSTTRHRALWDGTFLYVGWEQISNPATGTLAGIHAQKLNSSGVAQWGPTTTGITVMSTVTNALSNNTVVKQPRMVLDGSGNVWFAWVDGRDFSRTGPNGFQHAQDIYVQKLNAAGTPQLVANGSPVDTSTGTTIELQATPGTAGELLLVYKSDIFENAGDIMTTRVNTSGNRVGGTQFISPFNDAQIQQNPMAIADGIGGYFAAWDDNRANPNLDVYATHRTGALGREGPTLTLTTPNGGETLMGLRTASVTWTGTLPAFGDVKLEFRNGNLAPQLITASTPNDGAFTWTVPGVTSSLMRVVVSDPADAFPRDSSDLVFTVCNPLDIDDSFGPMSSPSDPVAADFNEDDILDIAVTSANGVFVLLGQGSGGVSNGSWSAPVLYATGPTGSQVTEAAVADFNGDGILDIATPVSAGVLLLPGLGSHGVGNGLFGADQGPFAAGGAPRGIVTADFNEDGIADLAVVNGSGGSLSILMGNGSNGAGDGTFAAATNYAIGSNPFRAVVADFNEDGIFDLAVCNSTSMSVLIGQGAGGIGNGTFAAAVNYATGTGAIGMATGDFNEDGNVDVVLSGLSSTGITVMIGNGDGTFDPAVQYATSVTTRDVVVTDVDTDGRADIVATDFAGDKLLVLFGDGSGTVGDGTFTLGGSVGSKDGPFELVAADFYQPGRTDYMVVHANDGNVSLVLGGCGTNLSSGVIVTSPNGGNFLQIGTNQLITWERGVGVLAVDVEVSYDGGRNWKTIATNQTGASFNWTVTGPPSTTALIRVRDPQLHDSQDVSNSDFVISSTPILVLDPNGGEALRGFNNFNILWGSNLGGTVKLEFAVDGGPRQTILDTTPNDGVQAWSVPNITAAQVKIYVSQVGGAAQDESDGTFSICQRLSAKTDFPAATTLPKGITAGDFNEDGISDLALSGFSNISVLLGQGTVGVGDGTFAAATPFALGLQGTAIASGDFNGDGITDLASQSGTFVRIFLGQGAGGVGNGSFALFSDFPLGSSASGHHMGLVVADFDEDGIEDIAGTSELENAVALILGNGTGGIGDASFGSRALFTVGAAPQDLAIGDFDEDGIWDLATVNSGDGTVSILRGIGSGGIGVGSFAAASPVGTSALGRSLIAADFNNDNITDLGVMLPGAVDVLRGNGSGGVGNGTFAAPVTSALPGGVGHDLAVMDFDFNGFPDLAVANESPDQITFMTGASTAALTTRGGIATDGFANFVMAGDFAENNAHDIAAVVPSGVPEVSIIDGFLCGASPGTVTIVPPPAPNVVAASGPSGVQTTWTVGTNQIIQWTKSANVFSVDLAASRDGGVNWRPIARNAIGTSFVWTVTPPATSNLLLRVSNANNPGSGSATTTPVVVDGGSVGVDPIVPRLAAFSQARPNPARSAATFELALAEETPVDVAAYDVNGRKVATIVEGRLPAGVHSVRWDASAMNAPAGVYFVRARWNGFEAVRHVVLTQ